MKAEPLWWDGQGAAGQPHQALPRQTDFAIVGSGFAGLSAALRVARAGRDVTVIEKHNFGFGAATRNAGFISNELKGGYLGLAARFGKAKARALMDDAVMARDFTLERIRAEQIQCSLNRCGRLILAAKPSHYEAIAQECEMRTQLYGSDNSMIERASLGTEINSNLYHGGWLTPDAHTVDPMLFHAGLVDRARSAGVRIVENCEVNSIERDGSTFTLDTSCGQLKSRNAFVATHGYCGRELEWVDRRIIKFGWYAIATQELPQELLQKLLPHGRAYADTKHLFNYFRPDPAGKRLIFGGRAPIVEMTPNRAAGFLRKAMYRIFPDLDGIEISHAWSGLIAFSFDLLPHIGNHNGIHYATSFTGPGLPMANYLGDVVARRVLEQAETKTAFDDIPLTGKPYFRGVSWFMPGAMLWYAAKDKWSS